MLTQSENQPAEVEPRIVASARIQLVAPTCTAVKLYPPAPNRIAWVTLRTWIEVEVSLASKPLETVEQTGPT